MPRYFLDVAYRGLAYSGFQKQENAVTIQTVVEDSLQLIFQQRFELTGSSRTDAGVNALQNFFHFDAEAPLNLARIYNLNAVLPADIAIKRFFEVAGHRHCRFDAAYREYHYHIYRKKDPFWVETAYHYPFNLDLELMDEAAALVQQNKSFYAFSKRNTQVKTYVCTIFESRWEQGDNHLVYFVRGNRFLRGMVRGLVGSMLQVGRRRISIDDFQALLNGTSTVQADFSPPGRGLFLAKVVFPWEEELRG